MATPTNLPTAFVAGDILTAANMNLIRGGFRILQVVQGVTSTAVTNSTTTVADTGLTATITPQFNTSKILVMVNQAGCEKTPANSQNAINLYLVRGATTIQQFVYVGLYTNTALENVGNFSTVFLDSPATTAATTYKTQFANFNASALVAVQLSSIPQSTITLLEISA
jgi:hypothetical protein